MPVQSGNENYRPDDEDPTPYRPRKNRARWCRGKPGREHTPIVAVDEKFSSLFPAGYTCTPVRGFGWGCRHHQVCSTCGKTLINGFEPAMQDLCPDLNPHAAFAP